MSYIQQALNKKRSQALTISEDSRVCKLAGLSWDDFILQMNFIRLAKNCPWDQIIACEVFDLINA